MKTRMIVLATTALALGGCQTVEEAATTRALTVCTQGGYGPSSPQHGYCVNTLKPVAVQAERQRRSREINEGLDMISGAFNPSAPKLTCVQRGAVTRCY